MNNLRQNLLANKTPLLIIVLVITTVLLVALAISPNRGSLPSPGKLTGQEVLAETTLSLSELYQIQEEEIATGAAEVFQTDVQIETGENKVTGVQLEIKYDPALLRNVDIVPGDFFQNPAELLKRIDTEEGVISYALGTQDEGVLGGGVVATISFSPLRNVSVETSFEFLSKTSVAAEGADKTVLRETSGLEFTLGSENTTSPSAQTNSASE